MCLCLLTNHICRAWLGTIGTRLGFGICIYMLTWCLDFDVCGAFELVDCLLCSAWLGTIGTHPLFCLVECLCMLDIE